MQVRSEDLVAEVRGWLEQVNLERVIRSRIQMGFAGVHVFMRRLLALYPHILWVCACDSSCFEDVMGTLSLLEIAFDTPSPAGRQGTATS